MLMRWPLGKYNWCKEGPAMLLKIRTSLSLGPNLQEGDSLEFELVTGV